MCMFVYYLIDTEREGKKQSALVLNISISTNKILEMFSLYTSVCDMCQENALGQLSTDMQKCLQLSKYTQYLVSIQKYALLAIRINI